MLRRQFLKLLACIPLLPSRPANEWDPYTTTEFLADDRPVFDLKGIPLPIMHSDFWHGVVQGRALETGAADEYRG